MSWLSIFTSSLYYLLLPFSILTQGVYTALLAVFSPLIYLLTYIIHALVLPLQIVGKFETLYIYFGVAAIIGILTGSILHFSSSIIVSILNLQTEKQQQQLEHSVQGQGKLDEPREVGSPLRRFVGESTLEEQLGSEYQGLLKPELGKRKEGQGLLSQIILEEDDDSDDAF